MPFAVDAWLNRIDLFGTCLGDCEQHQGKQQPHLRLDCFTVFTARDHGISFCTNMIAFFPPSVSICDMNTS
jgi:hypothetical protein